MKKLMSFTLVIAMLVGLMITPAFATTEHECNINGEATVTRKGEIGKTYNSYRTRADAEYHQLTYYAEQSDFPITVQLGPYGYSSSTRKITSYGIHRLVWENFYGYGTSFVIMVKRPSEAPKAETQPAQPKQPTKDQLLEQKTKTLIRALDLPCYYYTIDSCVYTKEIKAFLSGEWDGSRREGDDWAGYVAFRYVSSRTYYWTASDLISGETYQLSANVDYNGYKEIIPGRVTGQNYSLAVSRVNGEVEKWSLFEKQDAWKITQVANGSEQIQNIIPLATVTSKEDDCQVFVDTVDVDGQQHMYSLMPDGKVVRTV